MASKKLSRFAEAMLETAGDLHSVGIMDTPTYQKITIRHLGSQALAVSEPISGDEIRCLRERENLSQAAFARFLNLTVGYVSQMERGVRKPSGPALTLLNVIRRKGIQVML
jgi:putative transcriptional regulator